MTRKTQRCFVALFVAACVIASGGMVCRMVHSPSYGPPVIGILYDAQAGNDYCNGSIAPIRPGDPCPNLKECLHLDDVLQALPAEVPDSSKG